LEQKEVQEKYKVNQWDGMIHSFTGHIYDPQNGRDRTNELTEENDYVETESNDWFDQDFEENPNKLMKMDGSAAKIDPLSGRVGEFAQAKSY
jgi:hypothetical protein